MSNEVYHKHAFRFLRPYAKYALGFIALATGGLFAAESLSDDMNEVIMDESTGSGMQWERIDQGSDLGLKQLCNTFQAVGAVLHRVNVLGQQVDNAFIVYGGGKRGTISDQVVVVDMDNKRVLAGSIQDSNPRIGAAATVVENKM